MTTQFDRPPLEGEQQQDRDRAIGAVSVRGRPVRKTPLAWLPWVALALLGLLLLASLLIARNVTDAGDEPGVDATDDPAAEGSAPPTTAAPAPAEAPAATAGKESAVVAGGRALLPLPGAGLASLAGQSAEGKAANVQSVVADEGFWVGDDTTNRIFVFLTDEAKAAEGESPFQVKPGQRVDFAGTIKPIPDDLPPFGLEPAEGAEQLRQQGHYIELTKVALSN